MKPVSTISLFSLILMFFEVEGSGLLRDVIGKEFYVCWRGRQQQQEIFFKKILGKERISLN
jgi:hypothetical protein